MLKKIRLISLSTRALILMSLALLPLGIIAIWQTGLILKEQQAAGERALFALTEKAAARERQIVERSIGGAAALATSAFSLKDRPALCQTVLRRFVQNSTLYSFVAFYDANGDILCTSVPIDQADALQTGAEEAPLSGNVAIYRSSKDAITGPDSLVVVTPVFENNDYSGQLRLHVSKNSFLASADAHGQERPIGLMTFNADGQVLTVEADSVAEAVELLPNDTDLAALARPFQYSFDATGRNGEEHRHIVLPLVPGAAFALATWPRNATLIDTEKTFLNTSLFAAAVWLISLLTVYLVMHFLVIRGIVQLSGQMSDFRAARIVPEGMIGGRGELYQMEDDFRQLAQSLVDDEKKLEDSVHEKDVLLKEVHHRVKNNLQLINSIINMVLRGGTSKETTQVVRRLQDRVLALAAVHRMIYQSKEMDNVDAAPIVEEVVNQSLAIGLPKGQSAPVDFDLEPVILYPDQALPLTLLVSEGITNALKYSTKARDKITVSLRLLKDVREDGEVTASLQMSNAVADRTASEEVESTALGSKLMDAFARQLGGTLQTSEADGIYHLQIDFPVAQFHPDFEDASLHAEARVLRAHPLADTTA